MSAPRNKQPLQSVASMVHANAKYEELLLEFRAVDPTPEARLAFCAQYLGGGATFGLMQAYHQDLDLIERGREAVKLILTSEEGRKKTGVNLGLNRTPGMLVADPLLALLPSSSVLTYEDVLKVKQTVKAEGGCTIDVLCQPNRQKNNDCTGFHTEIIARPDNAANGQPIVLSVLLVPQNQGDWKIATQIITKTVGCERLGPVEAEGNLSRAFCSPPGYKALGPENMLLALRRDEWAGTLAEFSPLRKLGEAHTEPYYPLPFHVHPTEFVMSFDADEDALTLFLQIRALQDISVARGETLTFGSHYGFASCEAYAVTVLKAAFPRLFAAIDPAFQNLHELTRLLAENADTLYRAKIPTARIYDFGDDDKRDAAFEDVTEKPDIIYDLIEKICKDDNLNVQVSSNLPSWNNWFNNSLAVPQDPEAKFLYLQFAMAAIRHLEEKAEALGAEAVFDPESTKDGSPFAEELIAKLEQQGSSWATVLQKRPDPAVNALLEKMTESDVASLIDAMSIEDIRENMPGQQTSDMKKRWEKAVEQLEQLAKVLASTERPYPTPDLLTEEQALDDFLKRRGARKAERQKQAPPESGKKDFETAEPSAADAITFLPAPAALGTTDIAASPDLEAAATSKDVPDSFELRRQASETVEPSTTEVITFLPAPAASATTDIAASPDLEAAATSEDVPDPFELRRQAYEAVGIMIDNNPTRATEIKAICLAILKDVPDVGIALMFFWQSIRYAYSKDGGVTVTPGQNALAVASYTIAQPMMEVFTQYFALSLGAYRTPVSNLPYPKRAFQEYSYALKGGPWIGFLSKFINDVDHPKSGGGRLGWELLAVVPGLLMVSADRILEDYCLFQQKYEILAATDPVRIQFKRALQQIVKDFLSIEHWIKKRIVTFAALYAHEWTARSWYYLFQTLQDPYVRTFVGAPQFGTFFLSFVFLSQVAEKLFDEGKPRFERFMQNRRRIADTSSSQ